MENSVKEERLLCEECAEGKLLPKAPDFNIHFQPILDIDANRIRAYEALVTSVDGEPIEKLRKKLSLSQLSSLEQSARLQTIRRAHDLGLSRHSYLHQNLNPDTIPDPERCFNATLDAAKLHNLPRQHLIMEYSEENASAGTDHFMEILKYCHFSGMKTAMHHFSASAESIKMLAKYQPDYLRLGHDLVRKVHKHKKTREMLRNLVLLCQEKAITLVAPHVGHSHQFYHLHEIGIRYFQGDLFAVFSNERLPSLQEVHVNLSTTG